MSNLFMDTKWIGTNYGGPRSAAAIENANRPAMTAEERLQFAIKSAETRLASAQYDLDELKELKATMDAHPEFGKAVAAFIRLIKRD